MDLAYGVTQNASRVVIHSRFCLANASRATYSWTMRIGVDARMMTPNATRGIGRYIEELVRAAIAKADAHSARDIGAVMKVLMPDVKGKADGKLVNTIVKRLLG